MLELVAVIVMVYVPGCVGDERVSVKIEELDPPEGGITGLVPKFAETPEGRFDICNVTGETNPPTDPKVTTV